MRKVYKDYCGSCKVTFEVIMDVNGLGTSIKCSVCGTKVDRKNIAKAQFSLIDETIDIRN